MTRRIAALIASLALISACGNEQSNNGDGSNANSNANAGNVCDAFLDQDDGAGAFCDSGDDCLSVDCPCDDGSTVSTTSCFNGICEGRDACEATCEEFGAAYACAETNDNSTTNGTPNGSTNGTPNGSTNGTPNGSTNGTPNGNTNGTPNSSTNNNTATIPTGDPCPQFGCTPPVRPAATDCPECEGGKCYVSDGEAYCTIECSEAADCPASFDGNTQRRCVAGVCLKGIGA